MKTPMTNTDEEQTTPNEHWIGGISPWRRMKRFVNSYNKFPEERSQSEEDDEEES